MSLPDFVILKHPSQRQRPAVLCQSLLKAVNVCLVKRERGYSSGWTGDLTLISGLSKRAQ